MTNLLNSHWTNYSSTSTLVLPPRSRPQIEQCLLFGRQSRILPKTTTESFQPSKSPKTAPQQRNLRCYLCAQRRILFAKPSPYGGECSGAGGLARERWISRSVNGSGRRALAILLIGCCGR